MPYLLLLRPVGSGLEIVDLVEGAPAPSTTSDPTSRPRAGPECTADNCGPKGGRDRIAELGGPGGVIIEGAKTVVAAFVCSFFGCAEAGGSAGQEIETKSELEKLVGPALVVGGGAVVGQVVRGGGAAKFIKDFATKNKRNWSARMKKLFCTQGFTLLN